MRAHHGLAWLPVFSDSGEIAWDANPNYLSSKLGRRKARNYPELGLSTTLPIYESFRLQPESVQWVSDPERLTALWRDFQP
jgi:glucose-6-phosphate isomerase